MRLLLVSATVLISIAMALLLFEGVLALLGQGKRGSDSWRTGGYHAPDAELIYFPKPGATKVYKTAEFTEHVHINSMGLRDDELRPRTEFDFRIVIIGDSMTFGHGVEVDEAFPSVLERLYAERGDGRRVDVVNAAVKGYGTDQYYALFQHRLRRLQPDLLIVAFYLNDVTDNIVHPLYSLENGRLVPVDPTADPLYRIGRFNEMLPRFLRDTRVARWLIHQLVGSTTKPPPNSEIGERMNQERRKIKLEIADLVQTGKQDGFEVLVLGVPHRDGPATPYPWLESATRGRARLLDLSADPSWQRDKKKWFFGVDYHLNAAGQLRVAQKLFDYLVAEGF